MIIIYERLVLKVINLEINILTANINVGHTIRGIDFYRLPHSQSFKRNELIITVIKVKKETDIIYEKPKGNEAGNPEDYYDPVQNDNDRFVACDPSCNPFVHPYCFRIMKNKSIKEEVIKRFPSFSEP